MVVLNDAGEVRAAGGVVCRRADDGRLEVLLVHRGAYDDWTVPKGKVEEGESDEACAVREVEEETGVRGAVEGELPSVRWRDGLGRPKVARYWRMRAVGSERAHPRNEVDAVVWLPLAEAIERLSHALDVPVLRALADADKTGSR